MAEQGLMPAASAWEEHKRLAESTLPALECNATYNAASYIENVDSVRTFYFFTNFFTLVPFTSPT